MSDFVKYLNGISEELRILNEDISKIIAEKKNKGEENKVPSLKSIQSVTKMHKNKSEAENSEKNKEIDFIKDRINRIFSK